MNLMETPTMTAVAAPAAVPPAVARAGRWAVVHDFLRLAKPRLTLMVLFTVAVGYLAVAAPHPAPLSLLHALVGTALVAAAAGALNQLLEKDVDAAMRRTRHRPLPAGRLSEKAVLGFGLLTCSLGLAYLFLAVNPVAAAVALVTLLLYVLAYTPLKRKTALNTLVGAIPGALPPVIGCAAADPDLGAEAGLLFLLLFVWQFPHFWAIAWLYRPDYQRAGLRMLSVEDDEDGRRTGRFMVHGCLMLVLASGLPFVAGLSGPRYLILALTVGMLFTAAAGRFLLQPGVAQARQVLWASLVYLPVVLTALLLDGPWKMWGE